MGQSARCDPLVPNEVRYRVNPMLRSDRASQTGDRAQGCGGGARSIARGIATVLMVLAGASRLIGGRIRSPTHSSVASINASTPIVRRTNTVSRVNCDRRKRAVCSSVFVRIRNSAGDPRLRSVPHFRLLFELGPLSDHPTAIEKASDTDRLRIINLTGLSLWITCRAARSRCCPMFGLTGHSRWPSRFRG